MAEKEKLGTERAKEIIVKAKGAGALSLPEAQRVLDMLMLGGISVAQWKELEEAPGKTGELVRTYRAEKDPAERKKIADRLNKWIAQQDKGEKWGDESIRRKALQAHNFMAGELRRRPKGDSKSEKPLGKEKKETPKVPTPEAEKGLPEKPQKPQVEGQKPLKTTEEETILESEIEELFETREEIENFRGFAERIQDKGSGELLRIKTEGLKERVKGAISAMVREGKIKEEKANELLADFTGKEDRLLEEKPELFGRKEAERGVRRVPPVEFKNIHQVALSVQKFLDQAIRGGTEIRGIHHTIGRSMVEVARDFCEEAWSNVKRVREEDKPFTDLEEEAKRLSKIYIDLEWEYDSIKNLLDYWWKACVAEKGMQVAFDMGIAYGSFFRGAHMKWLWNSYRGKEILKAMGEPASELNITQIKAPIKEIKEGKKSEEEIFGSKDANEIIGKMIRLGSGLGVKDGAEKVALKLTGGQVVHTEANPGLPWDDWAAAQETVDASSTFLYELFKNHALDYYAMRYLRVRHPYADLALEPTGKYDEEGNLIYRDHFNDKMFFAYSAWQYVGQMEKFYLSNLQGCRDKEGIWHSVDNVRESAIGKAGEERLKELGWDPNKEFKENLRDLAMFDRETVIQAHEAGIFATHEDPKVRGIWDETKSIEENLEALSNLVLVDLNTLAKIPGSFYKLKQQLIYFRPGEIKNWHEFNFDLYNDGGILGAWAQNEQYMQRTRNDLIDFMRGKDLTEVLAKMEIDHFEHIPEPLSYIKDREITWWYDGYSRLIWPHLKERRDAGEGHPWVVDMRKLTIQGLVLRGWNRKVRFLGCGIRGIDFNKYPTSIETWGMVRQLLQGVSEIRLLRDGMLYNEDPEKLIKYGDFIKYAGVKIDNYHIENIAFNTLDSIPEKDIPKEDKEILKEYEDLPLDVLERQKWVVLNPDKAEKIFSYNEDVELSIKTKGKEGSLDFNWQLWEKYKGMSEAERETFVKRILAKSPNGEAADPDGGEVREVGDIFNVWVDFKELDKGEWGVWLKNQMVTRGKIDRMILSYPGNTIWKKTELGQFYDREWRTIDSFLEGKERAREKAQARGLLGFTKDLRTVIFSKLGLPLIFWQHEKDAYHVLRRQKVGMDFRRPEERMVGPVDEILGRYWVPQMIGQKDEAPIIFESEDPTLVLAKRDLEQWNTLAPEEQLLKKQQELLEFRIRERVGIDVLKRELVKTMEFCPGEPEEISPLFLYHNTSRVWRKLFARMSADYWGEYAKNKWEEKADEAWENYQVYRKVANPIKQWEIIKGAANAMAIDEGEFPDLAEKLKMARETAVAYRNEMGSWGVRDIEEDKPKQEIDPRYQQAFALATDELKVAPGGGLIKLLLGEATFKAQFFNMRNLLAGPFWLNLGNGVFWMASGGTAFTGVPLLTANFSIGVGSSLITWLAREKGESVEDLSLLAGTYFGIYGARERRRKPDVIKRGHTGFQWGRLPSWLFGFEWLLGAGLIEQELHDDTVNGAEQIQMFAKSKLELGGAEKS